MEAKKNIYTFLSLFLVLIIDTMSFGIIMPILPPLFLSPEVFFHKDISTNLHSFYYGITMATFFIFTFMGSPFLGELSDQLGRKKVIVLCMYGVAVGYCISAIGILSKSIFLLVLGRAINGLSAGSQSIAQAAIIDITPPEKKTLYIGLITLASGIGFIIGPIIGGYFSSLIPKQLFGFALPFIIATFLALINAISVKITFSETYHKSSKVKFNFMKAFTSLKISLNLIQLRILSVIYMLIQFGWGVFFLFTALYLARDFQYSPNEIGIFMAYVGIIFSISLAFLIRILLTFMNSFTLTLTGFCLVILGLALTNIFKSEASFWLSVIPIAIGIALSYASLTTEFSNRVGKHTQGAVMGLLGSLGSFSWFISGISIGFLTRYGENFPFIISMIAMIAGMILYIVDIKKHKNM